MNINEQKPIDYSSAPPEIAMAMPALLRAAEKARKIARMHGTDLVFVRDGKVVHERP